MVQFLPATDRARDDAGHSDWADLRGLERRAVFYRIPESNGAKSVRFTLTVITLASIIAWIVIAITVEESPELLNTLCAEASLLSVLWIAFGYYKWNERMMRKHKWDHDT